MNQLLLGVDIGTTRIKALLVDADGRVADGGVAAVRTPFVAAGDGAEMSVAALERALGEVVRALGDTRRRVAAVGIAGMAESGVPLVAGEPAAPVIAWFDGRGEETIARLAAELGEGLPTRIGQRLRTVSSVAKLGWLLDQGLPRPGRWLGVPETALYVLTGAEATEHSLAARTGAYDITRWSWIPEVIELLGVPADVFPEVRTAGEVMGRTSDAAARSFGLGHDVPVTLAGHDHLAGAEALGADAADVLNSVGTAETLLRRSADVPDVPRAVDAGLAVTVRPGGGGWVTLAGCARSGQVLGAFSADFGLSHEELDRRAERDEPPGGAWQETLEGLAAKTVAAAARLDGLLGPAARMIVYGGGSRSRPWLAAKAALVRPGLVVLRSTAPEATARGAALAAGVAAGWWPTVAAVPAPPLETVPPRRGAD